MRIDESVEALRKERARPEAKAAAIAAARRPAGNGRVFGWRWAAVAGLGLIVTIPLLYRGSSTSAYAAPLLQQVLEATAEAPIIHDVKKGLTKQNAAFGSECWYAGKRYSVRIEGTGYPISGYRSDGKTMYGMFFNPTYEMLMPAPDTGNGESLLAMYSLDGFVKAGSVADRKTSIVSNTKVVVDGKALQRYRIKTELGRNAGSATTDLYADPKTSRLVRIDSLGRDGKPVYRSTITYPSSVDESVFAPPPLTPGIPRFDRPQEWEELTKLAKSPREVSGFGQQTAILAVVQDPSRQLWVIVKGETDKSYPIRVSSLGATSKLLPIQKGSATINALGTKPIKKVETVNLEIPFLKNGSLLGYVKATNVPVRQTLPITHVTRSFLGQ